MIRTENGIRIRESRRIGFTAVLVVYPNGVAVPSNMMTRSHLCNMCQAQTPDSPEGLGPSLDVLQSLDPEAQLADVSLQLSVTQIYSLSQTAERGRQLPQTQTKQLSFRWQSNGKPPT